MIRFVIALILAFPAFSSLAGADVPQYKLTPGQEISYKLSRSFKYNNAPDRSGEHRSRHEWTGWVVRSNPDGSAQLLIREVSRFAVIRDGKESEDDPDVSLFYADVFPNGRLLPNSTIPRYEDPTRFLLPLPRDANELKSQWVATFEDSTYTCKSLGENRFEATRTEALDKIYLVTNKTTYTFDPDKSLIQKSETEDTQGYGFKGKGITTIELVGVKNLSRENLAGIEADMERDFTATAAYDVAVKVSAKQTPEGINKSLTGMLESLKAVEAKISQSDLKDAIQKKIKKHDALADYLVERSQQREKVVGKPVHAARSIDMEDKNVSLADLQGKVVVLDFWYRGCGWCVMAMPQMNQLVADFASEPVAILGMNTDHDKADAEFVIREMALKYPTLRINREEPSHFGVRAFPTLVIVDKKGIVRDLHVGYSKTLREDVAKTIRELLAEK